MTRFWVSWWSSYHIKMGCTKPPFQAWISGERGWNEEWHDSAEVSLVAVIDAESEAQIWEGVKKHFPDYDPRFCDEVADDWQPNDRFPDFLNQTRLEA